ncbi:MICAL-like protein 1 [Channa argus]|uniref:MICAL-like protein 1 n=1 Tax=Channa argus TaxID=215402 RepID=A0A6G1PAN0_CHAAH|nr:MICAL-like protein 1 [Channa argus]
MGSLKALQEWCRIQCQNYNDVEIKDMSTSFRDGLAFCAIIHRYRPDLIDFGSLSKENVYENNRLAFEVAETELGIPALLDPEDMVSMKVPDRLSIITYVSQYYNFFIKSQAKPTCVKRLSSVGHNEPAQKRPPTPLEDEESQPMQPAQTGVALGVAAGAAVKKSMLSSTCAACQKHVHLVQRFLVDGKLYHRNCFRCTECHSTLLPGSYKLGVDSGSLVCTHHFTRPALASQNGRPDLSKKPVFAQSARMGLSTIPHSPPSERTQTETLSVVSPTNDIPTSNSVTPHLVTTDKAESDKSKEIDGHESEEKTHSSSPPNPFDESDEEEEQAEKEEDSQTPAKSTANGDLPCTPDTHHEGTSRPVPAPRRVSEPTTPPRPAPRVRLTRTADGLTVESKRKKAPPPPPAGLATPPNTGSLSSLKGDGSRPSTPPPPLNPFEDDDENNEVEEEEGSEGAAVPPTVAATHPWYCITQTPDTTGSNSEPSGGRSSQSASPRSAKSKKRPAPRAPQRPASNQVQANQALSTESLSSGSEHSSSQHPLGGSASSDQEHAFTKSISEPSICSPCDSAYSPSSSSTEHLPHPSPNPSPVPPNASSAPATPQTSRSSETKWSRAPPPRPPVNPSPLATEATQSHNKVMGSHGNKIQYKAINFAFFVPAVSVSSIRGSARRTHSTGKLLPLRLNPKANHQKALDLLDPRPLVMASHLSNAKISQRVHHVQMSIQVQSDQYIPVEDIHSEMSRLEKQLDELEQRGVELEKKLRENPNDDDEEHLLVEWFTLIHEKHLLVRREAELVYTAKEQNLEERQADVEYELRCLLNKPEKDWTEEDKSREQELMAELVTIIEQRNQIVNNMDQDRQREEEEDKIMEAMLKKKEFHKDLDSDQHKKKGAKFKPIKVLKRLSHKGEPGKSHSPQKEKN